MVILALRAEAGSGVPCSRTRAAHAAEQLGKEIAEVGGLMGGIPLAAEFKAGVPVRWRAEFLARLVAPSQPVVGGAFFWVGKHGVRLVHLLHAQLGIRHFGNVRVVLAGELAEGLLDVIRRGITRHPQDLVVILELHAASLYSRLGFLLNEV